MRRATKKREQKLTPGKYPKFRSVEEQLKYFSKLKKQQEKAKQGDAEPDTQKG